MTYHEERKFYEVEFCVSGIWLRIPPKSLPYLTRKFHSLCKQLGNENVRLLKVTEQVERTEEIVVVEQAEPKHLAWCRIPAGEQVDV